MNVVDTSGWLEYFTEGENADFFAPAIVDTEHLIVPVICIYEVFKKVLQNQGQALAEFRVADLVKGTVIDLTASLAMSAAKLSDELKLPDGRQYHPCCGARDIRPRYGHRMYILKILDDVSYIEKKR